MARGKKRKTDMRNAHKLTSAVLLPILSALVLSSCGTALPTTAQPEIFTPKALISPYPIPPNTQMLRRYRNVYSNDHVTSGDGILRQFLLNNNFQQEGDQGLYFAAPYPDTVALDVYARGYNGNYPSQDLATVGRSTLDPSYNRWGTIGWVFKDESHAAEMAAQGFSLKPLKSLSSNTNTNDQLLSTVQNEVNSLVQNGWVGGTTEGYSLVPMNRYGIGQQTVVTYNMQGSTSGGVSKWDRDVSRLTKSYEVVGLQEVGLPPATNISVRRCDFQTTPDGITYNYIQYKWNVDLNTVRYITLLVTSYFANASCAPGQIPSTSWGKLNLAFVTETPPAAPEIYITNLGVNVQGNPAVALQNHRPAFGIKIGNIWYYVVHGETGGGGDIYRLIDNINFRFGQNAYNWMAFGDYNFRLEQGSPNFRINPATGTPIATIYRSYEKTHFVRSGTPYDNSEIDFFVSNLNINCTSTGGQSDIKVRRIASYNTFLSDHYPIEYYQSGCP
jgi:hypothetical protein